MDILKKYNDNKHLIDNGDILLFRGNAFISKAIEFLDHAYLSHSGLVLKKDEQLFILDSTLDKKTNGVEVDFLLNTIKGEVDFCVLRAGRDSAVINDALNKVIEKGIQGWKYNILFYLNS
jgi:hypothetical protein